MEVLTMSVPAGEFAGMSPTRKRSAPEDDSGLGGTPFKMAKTTGSTEMALTPKKLADRMELDETPDSPLSSVPPMSPPTPFGNSSTTAAAQAKKKKRTPAEIEAERKQKEAEKEARRVLAEERRKQKEEEERIKAEERRKKAEEAEEKKRLKDMELRQKEQEKEEKRKARELELEEKRKARELEQQEKDAKKKAKELETQAKLSEQEKKERVGHFTGMIEHSNVHRPNSVFISSLQPSQSQNPPFPHQAQALPTLHQQSLQPLRVCLLLSMALANCL
jgi:hypothetical protein